MLHHPEGQLLLGRQRGEIGRRRRFAGRLEYMRGDALSALIVERETKKAEEEHRTELAREAAEERVMLPVRGQRLRDADERFVPRGRRSFRSDRAADAHSIAVYRPGVGTLKIRDRKSV